MSILLFLIAVNLAAAAKLLPPSVAFRPARHSRNSISGLPLFSTSHIDIALSQYPQSARTITCLKDSSRATLFAWLDRHRPATDAQKHEPEILQDGGRDRNGGYVVASLGDG